MDIVSNNKDMARLHKLDKKIKRERQETDGGYQKTRTGDGSKWGLGRTVGRTRNGARGRTNAPLPPILLNNIMRTDETENA